MDVITAGSVPTPLTCALASESVHKMADLVAVPRANFSAISACFNFHHGLQAMRECEDQCIDMHCGNVLNSSMRVSPDRRTSCKDAAGQSRFARARVPHAPPVE